jgi:DNA repair photolyase
MFYRSIAMRWDNLRLLDLSETAGSDGSAPLPLFERGAVVRTFDTPEFRGVTFYEIRAKSIINRVPEVSRVPFRWTINPYRGCTHACTYCFARNTHTYLDMDYGRDFDSRIVVKVNAADLLRRELASATWAGEHIAMGTNVDPYQRAEGRYRLMRGIIEALRDAGNPFSILTKGSLILRDLDLLRECAERTDVGANVSVGSVDRDLWRSVEPGTPSPQKRLEVCAKLTDAGIGCGVLMAPILPWLSDSPEQLDATVTAIAAAGARHVTPIVLHLRPGAREWYLGWLAREHPSLVPRYRALYGRGSYARKEYQHEIGGLVHDLARRHRIGRARPGEARRIERGAERSHRDPPGSTGSTSPHGGHEPPSEQLSLV